MLNGIKGRHQEQGAQLLRMCYEQAVYQSEVQKSHFSRPTIIFPALGVTMMDDDLVQITEYGRKSENEEI